MIGQIVPAGFVNPRWMLVTREVGQTVYGRMWSAKLGVWAKGECRVPFAREALFRKTPLCPKPLHPERSGPISVQMKLAFEREAKRQDRITREGEPVSPLTPQQLAEGRAVSAELQALPKRV